jgi:hypothetical protein
MTGGDARHQTLSYAKLVKLAHWVFFKFGSKRKSKLLQTRHYRLRDFKNRYAKL